MADHERAVEPSSRHRPGGGGGASAGRPVGVHHHQDPARPAGRQAGGQRAQAGERERL